MNKGRIDNYLRITIEILKTYAKGKPFHLHLTNELRKKRSGSKDRRVLRNMCYSALRVRRATGRQPFEVSIAVGLALSEREYDEIAHYIIEEVLKVSANELQAADTDNRLKMLGDFVQIGKLFPLIDRVSPSLDKTKLQYSHLRQPLTWIRANDSSKLVSILMEKGVPFEIEDRVEAAVGVPPSTNVAMLMEGTRLKYEIQDLSSQLAVQTIKIEPGSTVWDACAGAGGKTLAMFQIQPQATYLVSDVRLNILQNLQKRFKKAGLVKFGTSMRDLTQGIPEDFEADDRKTIELDSVDVIVADVPCSGSGTWTRNPENLQSFTPKNLKYYVDLQQKIMTNVVKALKPGKKLVYLTCSVYTDENEGQVQWMEKEFGLKVTSQSYIKGYEHSSDSMFVAHLTRV